MLCVQQDAFVASVVMSSDEIVQHAVQKQLQLHSDVF